LRVLKHEATEKTEPHFGGRCPDEQALRRDLVQAVRDRLSARDCWLLEQRLQGRTWTEIAAADGGQAGSLRIMWARAVARVRRQFEQEPSHAS